MVDFSKMSKEEIDRMFEEAEAEEKRKEELRASTPEGRAQIEREKALAEQAHLQDLERTEMHLKGINSYSSSSPIYAPYTDEGKERIAYKEGQRVPIVRKCLQKAVSQGDFYRKDENLVRILDEKIAVQSEDSLLYYIDNLFSWIRLTGKTKKETKKEKLFKFLNDCQNYETVQKHMLSVSSSDVRELYSFMYPGEPPLGWKEAKAHVLKYYEKRLDTFNTKNLPDVPLPKPNVVPVDEQGFKEINAPKNIAIGMLYEREIKVPSLRYLAKTPSFDPKSGRIITTNGYDQETEIYTILHENFDGLEENPGTQAIKDSIEVLMKPFNEFPFDSPTSKGAFLQALFNIPVRPFFNNCPGLLISAPSAGSGKTLLAQCIAELSGQETALLPTISCKEQDEEIRKRILSLTKSGIGFIILDNLTGLFESNALCAYLTGGDIFGDRVLGQTQFSHGSPLSHLILNGNNVHLQGDIFRRVLTCKIDSKEEKPWDREFALNPLEYCRENKQQMLFALLTILKAWHNSGYRAEKPTGSFEAWSYSSRSCVLWLKEESYINDIDDPVSSIDSSFELDPDTQKLSNFLYSVYDLRQSGEWTVSQLISLANTVPSDFSISDLQKMKFSIENPLSEEEKSQVETEEKKAESELRERLLFLKSSLEEIAQFDSKPLNPRILGRWLEKHALRRVGGMYIVGKKETHGTKKWAIEKAIS